MIHTLNIFPQFLDLPPLFGPMVLRLTIAGVFLYLARYHFQNRTAVARELPLVPSSIASYLTYFIVFVEFVLAGMFLVGIYTQIASLLAVGGSIKSLFWQRGRPHFSPFSTSTYVLVLIVSLSLFIMGAGAFAIDLAL